MKTKNVLQNILNGVKTDLATLTKEANEGNGEDKLTLALAYENGYFGIPKDPAKAFEWVEKAYKDKKKIHPSYCGLIIYALGRYHYSGIGVDKDVDQGLHYYHQAANSYYCKFSCDALGRHYENNKDPMLSCDTQQYLSDWYKCQYTIIHEWGQTDNSFNKDSAIYLARKRISKDSNSCDLPYVPAPMENWIDKFLTEMEEKKYPKSKDLIINPS